MIGLLALVSALVVFRIGMYVGYEQAEYSFHWGDQYHQMFGGPPKGFFGDFFTGDFTDAHGLFGVVLGVKGNDIVLQDKDGTEKIATVTSETIIRHQTQAFPLERIVPQMNLVIIGEPELTGHIEAKMIRVFDGPGMMKR